MAKRKNQDKSGAKVGETKKKVFFPDTNIFGANPRKLFEFAKKPENTVVVTDVVLAELDKNKSQKSEFGFNCRTTLTNILKLANKGDLIKGVEIHRGGGTIKLFSGYPHESGEKDILKSFKADIGTPDLNMVRSAKAYADANKEADVKLVSMDKSVIIVSKLNGVKGEYLEGEQVDSRDLNPGFSLIFNPDLHAKYEESVKSSRGKHLKINEIDDKWATKLMTNQYVIFLASEEERKLIEKTNHTTRYEQITIYDSVEKILRPLKLTPSKSVVLYNKPRNLEQYLALDMLMDDERKVNVLIGQAGCGKTYLSLLAALAKTINRINYNKKKNIRPEIDPKVYVVKRGVDVQGEDKGFLPGTLEEKTFSDLIGVDQNLRRITNSPVEAYQYFEDNDFGHSLKGLMREPGALVQMLSLGKTRGMTFSKGEILVIEEAQNFEPGAMRTLVTRMGDGEVFINGDVTQIDNPRTLNYDGLTHISNRISRTKDPEYAKMLASLIMVKNERGIISEWATQYL